MKPTNRWLAFTLMIPALIAVVFCTVFGIIIWLVSLGHVNIIKYGFAITDAWGNLMLDNPDELKRKD